MSFQACSGPMGRFFAATAAVTLLFPATIHRAVAQEDASRVIPGAPHLLPEGTYAYVRLDNAEELRAGMAESSVGRMLSDPKMKPFATDLYATFRDLFAQISDEVGVSLDELLSIPSGQVAAAFIPGRTSEEENRGQAEDVEDESPEAIRRRLNRQRRRENSFAGVFIVDAGDNVDKLQRIVDRLERRVIEDGYVRRSKTVQKTEVVRLLPPRQGPPEVEYFERDDVIVFGIGHRTAQDVLDRWLDESDEPTLADSANFANVMARCVGAESTRPQLTFFVDPYHIAERVVMRSGSLTVGMFWPMIQDLGLARIRGLGATRLSGRRSIRGHFSHAHFDRSAARRIAGGASSRNWGFDTARLGTVGYYRLYIAPLGFGQHLRKRRQDPRQISRSRLAEAICRRTLEETSGRRSANRHHRQFDGAFRSLHLDGAAGATEQPVPDQRSAVERSGDSQVSDCQVSGSTP